MDTVNPSQRQHGDQSAPRPLTERPFQTSGADARRINPTTQACYGLKASLMIRTAIVTNEATLRLLENHSSA